MVILKYSEAKLYLAMLFLGACALGFLWLFLNPEAVADVRKARIFATGFGHYLLAPGFFLACLVPAVNIALIASGDLSAIRTTPTGLAVRGFWRAHDVPWKRLLRIRVEEKTYNKASTYYLLFDLAGEGLGDTVRLNFQHTKAKLEDLPAVIEAIHGHWQAASKPENAGASDARLSPTRRGATVPQPVTQLAPSPAAAPARPAFGRKGL